MGVNYSSMDVDQGSDPEVQSLKTGVTGLKLVDVKFDEACVSLLCDVSSPSCCTQILEMTRF